MSVYHDGCTAGPLSSLLNGLIRSCCDMHDSALDHTFDLGTFARGNWEFARCVWLVSPPLAVVVFLAVCGPVGLLMYYFGPKAGDPTGPSEPSAATPIADGAPSGLCEPPRGSGGADKPPSGAAP